MGSHRNRALNAHKPIMKKTWSDSMNSLSFEEMKCKRTRQGYHRGHYRVRAMMHHDFPCASIWGGRSYATNRKMTMGSVTFFTATQFRKPPQHGVSSYRAAPPSSVIAATHHQSSMRPETCKGTWVGDYMRLKHENHITANSGL